MFPVVLHKGTCGSVMIECQSPESCLIMPSIEHESAAQILHANPQLVAMLLGTCGVTLPSGAIPLAADSNLSDRDPTDLRSDNVLIFEGAGGRAPGSSEPAIQALTWPRWSAAPAPCPILAIRCTVRS